MAEEPTCRVCGATNRPEDRFCGVCGAPLPAPSSATGGAVGAEPRALPGGSVRCWNCRTPSEEGRTFCQRCGERLVTGSATHGGGTGGAGGGSSGAGVGSSRAAASTIASSTPPSSGPGVRPSSVTGARLTSSASGVGVSRGRPGPVPVPEGSGRRGLLLGGTLVGGAFLGFVAVFLAVNLLGGQGGGTPGGGPPGLPTPTTRTAAPSDGPSVEPSAEPTPEPTPRPTRRPTPRPTRTAAPSPTETPAVGATAAPASDFTCGETRLLEDPLGREWALTYLSWGSRGSYDRVTLRLERDNRAPGEEARAEVTSYPVGEVEPALGVPDPSIGRMAVVVSLGDGVRIVGGIDTYRTSLRTVKEVAAHTQPDTKAAYVVLGVAGDGCYALQVPAWQADPPTRGRVAEVVIDVER